MILLLVFLLSTKHLIADYFLQTKEMVSRKGIFADTVGMLHSLIHAMLSLVILLSFPDKILIAFVLCYFEFVVHYLIDYIKQNLTKSIPITNKLFWWSLGIDQYAHYLTYILMILIFTNYR